MKKSIATINHFSAARLWFLLAVMLSSCTVPQLTPSTQPKPAAYAQHAMANYFSASSVINKNPLVTTFIQQALQDPKSTEPLYSLGYLHMQTGIANKNAAELTLAEHYLNAVLAQFPGNQAVLQALYNVHYDNTLYSRSPTAFAQARAIFMQIPESGRTELNPPSLAKFAATLTQQQETHQADRQALRDILLAAIQEAPQAENAYLQLAKLYSDDRYFALAIATLKLGVENNLAAANNLAVEKNSTLANLYKAIGNTYTNRAEVTGCDYEHPSDIKNASHYYQQAIPHKPDEHTLHRSLAYALIDQNRTQLGLYEAQLAIEIEPSTENLSTKALLLSSAGYHTQAAQLLEMARAKGYGHSETRYHEIYMNSGEWTKAAESFQDYLKQRTKVSVYDLIKSDIITQQTKISAWPRPRAVSAHNAWEKALLQFWQAQISSDDLKKIALTRCEKTEYFFYTGYRDLQAGNSAQAHTKFNAALAQNTYRFIERPLARYFLQQQD